MGDHTRRKVDIFSSYEDENDENDEHNESNESNENVNEGIYEDENDENNENTNDSVYEDEENDGIVEDEEQNEQYNEEEYQQQYYSETALEEGNKEEEEEEEEEEMSAENEEEEEEEEEEEDTTNIESSESTTNTSSEDNEDDDLVDYELSGVMREAQKTSINQTHTTIRDAKGCFRKLEMTSDECLEAFPKGEEKFDVIAADPPWKYKYKRDGRVKYADSDIKEILRVPVARIAAKDSFLFLWTTSVMYMHAYSVMKAWGFEYKTVWKVWCKTYSKQNKKQVTGIGHYSRTSCEFLLVGTRGHPLMKFKTHCKELQMVETLIKAKMGVDKEIKYEEDGAFFKEMLDHCEKLEGAVDSVDAGLTPEKPLTFSLWKDIINGIEDAFFAKEGNKLWMLERLNVPSKKPRAFYRSIETYLATNKRIELYARKVYKGWSSWGLELEKGYHFDKETYNTPSQLVPYKEAKEACLSREEVEEREAKKQAAARQRTARRRASDGDPPSIKSNSDTNPPTDGSETDLLEFLRNVKKSQRRKRTKPSSSSSSSDTTEATKDASSEGPKPKRKRQKKSKKEREGEEEKEEEKEEKETTNNNNNNDNDNDINQESETKTLPTKSIPKKPKESAKSKTSTTPKRKKGGLVLGKQPPPTEEEIAAEAAAAAKRRKNLEQKYKRQWGKQPPPSEKEKPKKATAKKVKKLVWGKPTTSPESKTTTSKNSNKTIHNPVLTFTASNSSKEIQPKEQDADHQIQNDDNSDLDY